MANSAQARKRARQAVKNRAHNASLRTAFRTAVKKVLKAVEAGDKAAAQSVFRDAVKVLDRDSQNTRCRPSPSGFGRHGFVNQPSEHQHHQRLRGTQHRRQTARPAIRRHKQHGLEKADVQKTEQNNRRPFAAFRYPPRPRQKQKSCGQNTD